jgi:hypothetical protein
MNSSRCYGELMERKALGLDLNRVHRARMCIVYTVYVYIQYQSKFGHLLIQGIFFIFNIFYIVEL